MNSSNDFYPTLPAQDLERAKKFYSEIMGLKPVAYGMEGLVFFENDAHNKLMLFQRPPTKADNSAVAFVVDDVDKTVDELAAKGVHCEQYDMGNGMKTDARGVMTWDNNKVAWFKDTEGNLLSLHTKK